MYISKIFYFSAEIPLEKGLFFIANDAVPHSFLLRVHYKGVFVVVVFFSAGKIGHFFRKVNIHVGRFVGL